MHLPGRLLPRLLHGLKRRLVLIVVIVGLGFDGWMVWQGLEQWAEPPLPPERISAKQLRVNESQRVTLEEGLQQYHQPQALTNTSTVPFAPTAGGR